MGISREVVGSFRPKNSLRFFCFGRAIKHVPHVPEGGKDIGIKKAVCSQRFVKQMSEIILLWIPTERVLNS